MGGDYEALETLMASKPDILNHNIETVRRLTPRVRARATYDRTLEFLRRSKELQPDIPTKSSIVSSISSCVSPKPTIKLDLVGISGCNSLERRKNSNVRS